ncbi:Protein of unknown function [Pyronema omphalodes CBS 100304]|uniref:Uncharacterized protein n=1 Tax=Pyronema omphalodes (strain CBS 100304) TaxID=1076935 RepID=U4L926_PYROM|nr:Protein of unknown function [Pyronema omphalodes CBS 100304]
MAGLNFGLLTTLDMGRFMLTTSYGSEGGRRDTTD